MHLSSMLIIYKYVICNIYVNILYIVFNILVLFISFSFYYNNSVRNKMKIIIVLTIILILTFIRQ